MPQSDPDTLIAERAQRSLEQLAERLGFNEIGGDLWGPCPQCEACTLTIVSNRPDDPFLWCRDPTCNYGAGIGVLSSLERRGWRVGQPLPPKRRR